MANKSYKGRRFEIALATQLSLWWSGTDRDDIYWHTHDSGGRATRRARKGKSTKNHSGDICATDAVGQPLLDMFTIEAKKGYNRATIADLLDKPGAALQVYEEWILQASESAKQAGTPYWMIVHRRDKRNAIVLMEREAFLLLWKDDGKSLSEETQLVFTPKGGEDITIITLEQFFNNTDPKLVYETMK